MSTQLSEAVRLLIDKLMKAQNVKVTQLARASGIPQTSMSRKLAGGRTGRFDLDDVAAIAPVFHLTASDLIAWAERSLHPKG